MRTLIRRWRRDGFRLDLFDINQRDEMGKHRLAYRFYDGAALLFDGEDFACSPCHAIDSERTVASLLGFLALKPGDTDREYVDRYTPAQREWCESQRAEVLGCLVNDIENPPTRAPRPPTMPAVRAELAQRHLALRRTTYERDLEHGAVDVRLQLHDDGQWSIHTGDSSYDQDHRGHWGSASLPWGNANLSNIARDLINQVRESIAQSA